MTTSTTPISLAGTASPVSVAQELGLGLTTTISLNDAAVRTLAGAGGSGTVNSMNSLRAKSAGGIVTTLSFGQIWYSRAGGISTARVIFNTDGTITHSGTTTLQSAVLPTNWYTPTTPGIGSSYYLKILPVSGDALTSNPASAWVSLATSKTMTLSTSSGAAEDLISNFTVQMSSGAAGTPLLVNSSGWYLEAQRT
jgi:hypothetical protein